jgi:hypothetical protein
VVYDRSSPEKIDRLRDVAHTLIKRDGAESVLLAGTDLSMVLNEDNAGFPDHRLRRRAHQGDHAATAELKLRSAHSRESGNPGPRTGSPLPRGRAGSSSISLKRLSA